MLRCSKALKEGDEQNFFAFCVRSCLALGELVTGN